MGACDTGRCCKGSLCSNSKKCCCTAGGGTFAPGEVCRTAACTNGGSCDYKPVCDCEASGGTLGQSCDPCNNVACGKCERCVEGTCRSTCSGCQTCDTNSINGTCVDRPCSPACGPCQTCACVDNNRVCIATGVACGSTCCSFSQCCVNGSCVSCDCTGPPVQIKPGECYECRSGLYVNKCTSSQRCCSGTCAECCVTEECPENYKCVAGKCEPKQCGDYKESIYIQCYYQPCGQTLTGYVLIDGNCYCAGGSCYDLPFNNCPTGCIPDPNATAQALPSCTTLVCCQSYDRRPCISNTLP